MSTVADLRSVLRGRDFRRLYAVRLTSQLSDGIFQFAVAGYVFFFSPEQQTGAGRVAAAFAVLLLPYSIIGPFAGVFIDRWRRRQILLYAPVLRGVLVATAAILLMTGDGGVPFYVVALLVVGVNRFFLAALSAALPHVVARGVLVTANSVSVTSGTIIAFVGAGVGYLLQVVVGGDRTGAALILLVAAGVYLTAAGVAITMGRDLLGPDLDDALPQTREALRNVARGLVDGARHVGARRPAAAALGAISLHRFLYGITTIMTVLLFANYFTTTAQAGLSGLALILVVSGIGYFLGAVITPPVTARIRKQTWISIQLGAAAITMAAFGAPFAAIPFVVGGFFLGLVAQGVKICVDTILQETVLDAYRGRVFSLYDMLFNVMFVLAAGFSAITLPTSGRSHTVLGIIVGGYALGALAFQLAARRTAQHRSAERQPSTH